MYSWLIDRLSGLFSIRLLWYPEIDVIQGWTFSRRGHFGGGTLAVVVRACRFAVSSLIALSREMFTLSKSTHGGFLIGLMFFYTAFVMGTALFIETGNTLSACSSMGTSHDCTISSAVIISLLYTRWLHVHDDEANIL
jgi:hypothetical protein